MQLTDSITTMSSRGQHVLQPKMICTHSLHSCQSPKETRDKKKSLDFGEHSGNQLSNPTLSQRTGKYRCRAFQTLQFSKLYGSVCSLTFTGVTFRGR